MPYATSLVLLAVAACLEAGGDALIRVGLHSTSPGPRVGFLLAGALALTLYGATVNAPPWDFGRLIGVYVVFFFLIAQIIAWVSFGTVPSARILLGGALVVAGGAIISAR